MGLPSCRGSEGGRGFGSVFRHENSKNQPFAVGFSSPISAVLAGNPGMASRAWPSQHF